MTTEAKASSRKNTMIHIMRPGNPPAEYRLGEGSDCLTLSPPPVAAHVKLRSGNNYLMQLWSCWWTDTRPKCSSAVTSLLPSCACSLGREETMQPAKPSFLEYFEQKEKEANNHGESPNVANNADNRKFPAEVDMEVVSLVWSRNTVHVSHPWLTPGLTHKPRCTHLSKHNTATPPNHMMNTQHSHMGQMGEGRRRLL